MQKASREFDVVVYPESMHSYTAQIYAGLYDLSSDGTISLRFANRLKDRRKTIHPRDRYVWLDVFCHASGQRRTVVFDLIDGGGFQHLADIDQADVVIKRSYDHDIVLALAPELRSRVQPFGLHYSIASRKEKALWGLQHQIAHHSIHGKWKQNLVGAIAKVLWKPLQLHLSKRKLFPRLAGQALSADSFEGSPKDPVEHKVFFRTRVYADHQAAGAAKAGTLEAINEFRVAVVRTLKKHFGDRFVGGLRRSALVEKKYPDCLYPDDLDARGHIAVSKQYLINVNTIGLHRSTGWKLPEILAAARCAVSEAPAHHLPHPLIAGKHFLSFADPQECAAACERLLDDPELATSIREQGFDYYWNYLRPGSIVYQSLVRSFA